MQQNFSEMANQSLSSPIKFRDFGDNAKSNQRWQVDSPSKIKKGKNNTRAVYELEMVEVEDEKSCSSSLHNEGYEHHRQNPFSQIEI